MWWLKVVVWIMCLMCLSNWLLLLWMCCMLWVVYSEDLWYYGWFLILKVGFGVNLMVCLLSSFCGLLWFLMSYWCCLLNCVILLDVRFLCCLFGLLFGGCLWFVLLLGYCCLVWLFGMLCFVGLYEIRIGGNIWYRYGESILVYFDNC